MTMPVYPVVEVGVVVDEEVDDVGAEVESEFEVEAGVVEVEISGVVIVEDRGESFVVDVMAPVVDAPTNAWTGMLAPLVSIIE